VETLTPLVNRVKDLGRWCYENIQELHPLELHATDGELGVVREFYFDDQDWAVLYLAVDTGSWLPGRRILVSPIALGEADWVEKRLDVMLTRAEIEESPNIDLHQPITSEQEVAYFGHFGWPCLWSGELRSTSEVIGAQIKAAEGLVGRVDDLLVDESWMIRYLVVGAQARKALLAPQWIERADWSQPTLYLNLLRGQIEQSPPYDPSAPVSREYETRIYGYYGVAPYWS
jgi:hypothetical protein